MTGVTRALQSANRSLYAELKKRYERERAERESGEGRADAKDASDDAAEELPSEGAGEEEGTDCELGCDSKEEEEEET